MPKPVMALIDAGRDGYYKSFAKFHLLPKTTWFFK